MNIFTAYPRPGEIVNVKIFNGIENPGARGKERPGLLVAEDGGHWWVLGFTSQREYKTGDMAGLVRRQVREPERYGLTRPSYMWSSRLARVSKIDVSDHFGFADRQLVDDVIEFTNLYGAWAEGLRNAVEVVGVER